MAVASGGTHRIVEQVLVHLGIRQPLQRRGHQRRLFLRQKPAPDISWKGRADGSSPSSAALTKTPSWACKPSRPREWKRSDVRELIEH